MYIKKASVEADVEMLQQTYTFSDLAIKYIKQIEEEFSNNNKTCLFFVDPAQSNQRLVMQQGLFMFPYVLDQEEHKNIIESNTKLLKIGKKLRSELQGYLDTLGLNAFRLMPDLASVCEAVKRNVKKNG